MFASRWARPGLSIVIPAYNEGRRLPRTLAELRSARHDLPRPLEVIIVDDGSSDGTAGLSRKLKRSYPFLRLIRHRRNLGKGRAVATGALAARGRVVLFTDADLPVTPRNLRPLLAPLASRKADVAIASRIRRGAFIWPAPFRRRILSRLFNRLVRALVLPGLHDSQCGCKAFDRRAARDIFSRLKVRDFSFDIEVLLLARKFRYRVREVSLPVRYEERSSVRLLRDGPKMLVSLLRLTLAAKSYRPPRSIPA